MAGEKDNIKVSNILNWARLIIPILVAAIGWYVGQTVGSLNTKLDKLETELSSLNDSFLEYRADDQARIQDIQRRLSASEVLHDRFLLKSEFDSRTHSADQRMDRIEDKLDHKN